MKKSQDVHHVSETLESKTEIPKKKKNKINKRMYTPPYSK